MIALLRRLFAKRQPKPKVVHLIRIVVDIFPKDVTEANGISEERSQAFRERLLQALGHEGHITLGVRQMLGAVPTIDALKEANPDAPLYDVMYMYNLSLAPAEE